MRVAGVLRVWPVSPDIGMREAFSFELSCKFFLIHHLSSLSGNRFAETATPSFRPLLAVRGKEGAPSSGEKIVCSEAWRSCRSAIRRRRHLAMLHPSFVRAVLLDRVIRRNRKKVRRRFRTLDASERVAGVT